jgi:hypothetical protein
MKTCILKIVSLSLMLIAFLPLSFNQAQVQRNPVIEACTGTWCQYCPCGHDIIDNILTAMPNAIALEYHGPTNSSDPWRFFNGNEIIGLLGYTGYPTGVIDRTGAPLSRSSWPSTMNMRLNVPANVDIRISKFYNQTTRELDITIHSTAQTNLTGEYKLNLIIIESGLVYPQSGNPGQGCIGGTNYVHKHIVRSMINGALGEVLNGTTPWNAGQTISKNIQYNVPAEYIAENCELVAFVYKVESPLYLGQIQQGEKRPLISPPYLATIDASTPDVITANNVPGEFSVTLRNEGSSNDTYYVEGMIDGPAGWSGQFTTSNGTFNFGQKDSIEVAVNSTADVSFSVNPNSVNGFGKITLRFTSKNEPGVTVQSVVRLATTTGLDFLIIDASNRNYGSYIDSSLSRVADTASFGIISRKALQSPNADLSHYYFIAWTTGFSLPVFDTLDVTLLTNYLDQGGRLLITGQDIGADIFDTTGQSQFAADFYNNYLHASYDANAGPSFFITGLAGDPIGNGLVFPINLKYPRSPDQISPYDANATGVFQFSNGPLLIGLKAQKDDYRVVYYGFGIEQIDDVAARDSIISRSVAWLMEGVVTDVNDNRNGSAYNYSLNQNYPNPFNPVTTLSYSIANAGNTTIKIYDIMGGEVSTIINSYQQPGNYTVAFDASSLASGLYIYKLASGNFSASRKMIVLK